jgi:serine/threonine protein kinase
MRYTFCIGCHRTATSLSTFARLSQLASQACFTQCSYKTAANGQVLVVEYLPGGDLCEHMATLSRDHAHALDLFAQVVDAVAHLHKHGFVHNDIKADNVLLSADGTPKLCDFGLACKTGQPRSGGGTSLYMAPELFTGDGKKAAGVPANPMHDVWSLGITLFAILTDGFPWQRAVPEDPAFETMQAHGSFDIDGLNQYEQKV